MSEQGNPGAAASATADVRPEAGAVTPAATPAANNATATETGAQQPAGSAQISPDAGTQQGSASPPAGATGAAGQAQSTTPLKGPLGASASPSPGAVEAVSVAWPDNWRDAAAGGDAGLRQRLERYGDPSAVAKALDNAQKLISSRATVQHPGADATPEQLAEWHELSGVPAKPEEYKLPDTVKFGDNDKPIVDGFLQHAHAAGLDQKAVGAAVEYFGKINQAAAEARATQDAEFGAKATETLQQSWGADFKRNINLVQNLFAGLPEGVGDAILASRTPDGRVLGDNPEVLNALVGMARELNPVATLLPAGHQDLKGIGDRVTQLKAMMGDRSSAYWKEPKLQEEYIGLLRAQEKLSARG
jgi:hypothetical protein